MTINQSFEWRDTPYGRALVCGALEPYAPHLFTTREWALGSRAGAADEDWQPVAAALGVDAAHLVRMQQVHGADVVVVRAGDSRRTDGRSAADAAVTNDSSVALAIQTADCVPLLIADRRTGVVAAAHAGWRGLAAGVPGVTIASLARAFGSAPADLVAAVGPSICADRYEVGNEVREQFSAAGFAAAQLARWFVKGARADRWQFDGWQSATDQLESAGLRPDSIHVAGLCTATHADLFCSYRRDGKGAGRIAAAIRRTRR
ncbi:MAG: yfiH [Acidobacteria bacterium]|nr:yfiH [Acidobacteriota bacterium]